MGHKVLEEKIETYKKQISQPELKYSPIEDDFYSGALQFFLTSGGINAQAIQTNEGIVVLKNSEAAKESSAGLSLGYKELREKLIQTKKLKLVENKLIFQDNVVFDSPSQAGAAILGYNVNGRIIWKDAAGKTFKEIEERKLLQPYKL